MRHRAKFIEALELMGGQLASSILGDILVHLTAAGMSPKEIGEFMEDTVLLQLKLNSTSEAVRSQAARDQVSMRAKEILDEGP